MYKSLPIDAIDGGRSSETLRGAMPIAAGAGTVAIATWLDALAESNGSYGHFRFALVRGQHGCAAGA